MLIRREASGREEPPATTASNEQKGFFESGHAMI